MVTGFGAAIEGTLAVPAALESAIARMPFPGVDRSIVDRSPSAAALIAAIARAIAHPCAGQLPPPEGRAIIVGTWAAALNEVICFLNETLEVGPHLVNPGLFPFTVINAAAGIAAIEHSCRGPNLTLSNGRTSAFDAIAYAADLVAAGRTQVAFAGGFEGLSSRVGEALVREGPPVSMAVVFMISTREYAEALGAFSGARLLAYSAGDWSGDGSAAAEDARVASVVQDALRLAAGPVTVCPPLASATPEFSLLSLLEAMHRLESGGGAEELVPLVATGDSGGTAAALVLGSGEYGAR